MFTLIGAQTVEHVMYRCCVMPHVATGMVVSLISPPQITAKINVNDYSAKETSDIVSKVQRLCPHGNKPSSLQQHGASLVGVVTVAAVLYAYWNGYLNDI